MSQRKMNGYMIFHTLGKGGFSKVKLGIHETTKERVGLKLLKKDRVSGNIRKQVERELNAMAKIQHENVIRLKEVEWNGLYPKKNGTKVEVILVVLELATGGELFEYLSFTGLFEENIARTYFRQLIDGVSYCHSKGIAHRDLKPENVLYDEHFVLKIADFGFSNAFEDTDKTMYTECGTPGYMAPEMFKRSGYDASACDVWACGVILFIMLASFPPFQRPAMTDWWFNKLHTMRYQLFWEAHCRSAYFSEAAKDLINKMLCVDPSKRISMDQIKKHTFFQGPVVSASALYAEFTRRKAIVDEKKFRERSTADRDLAEKFAATNNEDDMLTEGTVRGENDTIINAESDSIPAAPPARLSVDLYLVKEEPHDSSHASFGDDNTNSFAADDSEEYEQSSADSLSAASSSSSSSSGSSSEVKAPLLDGAFLPSFGFSHFTVGSAHSVSSILSRVDQILTSKKIDHTVKASSAKIKGRLILKDGTLEFAIQLYQNAQDSSHQVVFTRVTGDGQDFFRFFAGVRAQATDIIAIPEHSAPVSSSSSSSTALAV